MLHLQQVGQALLQLERQACIAEQNGRARTMRAEPAHRFDPRIDDARMLTEAKVVLGCEIDPFTRGPVNVGNCRAWTGRRLQRARVGPKPVLRSTLDVVVEATGALQKISIRTGCGSGPTTGSGIRSRSSGLKLEGEAVTAISGPGS